MQIGVAWERWARPQRCTILCILLIFLFAMIVTYMLSMQTCLTKQEGADTPFLLCENDVGNDLQTHHTTFIKTRLAQHMARPRGRTRLVFATNLCVHECYIHARHPNIIPRGQFWCVHAMCCDTQVGHNSLLTTCSQNKDERVCADTPPPVLSNTCGCPWPHFHVSEKYM